MSKENRKYERIFRLVQQYSELTELSLSQYKILKDLSQSHDSWIRCNVAKELINFGSNEAKTILCHLANDKDDLVRIEAYDSLSVYKENDVKILLKDKILSEEDGLARSYAIMSWSEIALELNKGCEEEKDIDFILGQKKKEKSEHCQLDYEYAIYIRKRDNLDELINFLKSKDYHIRCSFLNTIMQEHVAYTNEEKEKIRCAIVMLLKEEKARAVYSLAQKALCKF